MSKKKGFLRVLVGIVLWWALYGLMLASQVVGMVSAEGATLTWPKALIYAYGGTWTWVPMSCIAYYLAKHFTIGKHHLWRNIAIHVATVTAFILFKGLYMYFTNPIFGWYGTLPPLQEVIDTSARLNLMLGFMVVGMAHGVAYFERTEDRERAMAELERSLALTKLEALRSQLNPHFLFNALNSVAELMQTDVDKADRMLVAICDMLRESLRTDNTNERPLREELRHVSNYLTIEGIRLGDRMTSLVNVDNACLDIPVPALSLQPVVENAIIHSIARTRSPGWVEISAWVDDQDLNITVINSAINVPEKKTGNGVGLKSVSDRLTLLYGARGKIHQSDSDKDTYKVHIVVPLKNNGLPGDKIRAEARA